MNFHGTCFTMKSTVGSGRRVPMAMLPAHSQSLRKQRGTPSLAISMPTHSSRFQHMDLHVSTSRQRASESSRSVPEL